MRKFPRLRATYVAAILLLASTGCTTFTHEPPNLSLLKQQIRTYVESGDYLRDIDVVAARAKAWVIERAAKGGDKLTVVFDLDETLLMNWPHISAMDFGYVPSAWEQWVNEAKAPAIEPVRDVFRTARRLGVDVVLITGRPENHRGGTVRNLTAIECADYAALICKPADHQGGAVAFKAGTRERLTGAGRTIIANIGDQDSDLSGGWSEKTFKLPNAFYQLQ